MQKILLASSSKYRAKLLAQLQIKFSQESPDINECQKKDESAIDLAKRLSIQKAKALRSKHPEAVIIASDQVAYLPSEDLVLNKPLNFDKAVKQLSMCSGKELIFYTGLCVYPPESCGKGLILDIEEFRVKFRQLSKVEIANYVELEKPFDCAGSFKVEGLGIHLFEHLCGHDYNSLIGLPLIQLSARLRELGLNPLLNEYSMN